MSNDRWTHIRKHLISIRMKILLIAFVAIAGFGGYLSYINSVALANSSRIAATETIYYPILTHATNAINALNGFTSSLEVALATADEDLLDNSSIKGEEIKKELDEIAKLDDSLKPEIDALKSDYENYHAPAITLAKALIEGHSSKVDMPTLMGKVTAARPNALKSFTDFKARRFATFTQALEKSDHSLRNAINAGIVFVVVILILLTGIAWFVAHAITKRVKDVAASLNEMAKGGGDLTHQIASEGADEINDLVSGFNLFVAKLRHIIADIIASSHEMTQATTQISNSIQTTSNQVNKQNNRTIEVATSIERMVINVNKVSDNARKALNVAEQATSIATEGQTTVNKAIGDLNTLAHKVQDTSTLIEELGRKNAKIGGIVKSIQDITEQTNLLALNATIESARAGEHGRGFAVVAEEVRGLANRTAKSAREIRGIIDSLLSQTNEVVSTMTSGREQASASVEHAAEAAHSLSTITDSIQRIHSIIDQIGNATAEQNQVANEINESVFQVSEISIETAGEAARTAESAQQLSELALKLNKMVSQFKV